MWDLEKVDEEELREKLEKMCSKEGVEVEIKDEEAQLMYEGEEEDSFYRSWDEEEDEETIIVT